MKARVLTQAGAGPPLVYVPGVDGCGELLYGTATELARGFRLSCLRYEGTGGGYEELARSVRACLDEQGCERALLLAESFGVGVALTCALQYPDRVAGLMLVNGFARYERRWRVRVSHFVALLCPQVLVRTCRRRFGWRSLLAPRREPAVLERLLAREIELDAGYRHRLALSGSLDLLARLGEIRVPVALYASDHDRIVDSVPAARAMAARLPRAELTILREAGHVVLPLPEEPWLERMTQLARRAGLA
jgi:pimeloyl-ACP methyl ester carboxylesterase